MAANPSSRTRAGAGRGGASNAAGEGPAEAGSEQELTFEDALQRLETIVEELESGALSLDDSLARYEEGVRLSRHLTRTLDQAEKRIERLIETPDGGTATRPLELETRPGDEGPGEGELPF